MKRLSHKKIKTSWDLKGMFYSSLNDPRLVNDIKNAKLAYKAFEKRYKSNKAYLRNEKALLGALKDWKKLLAVVGGQKPLRYCNFRMHLDGSDKKVAAFANKLSLEMEEAANSVLFFELDLGMLPKALQKVVLTKKSFESYGYFFSRILLRSRYKLSEKEERLMNLLALPSGTMWEQGVSRVVSSLTVLYRKEKIPIAKAFKLISDLSLKERHALHKQCMEKLWTVSEFAESEINAIYTTKKISDDLRKYPKPYSATALSHQTSEKEIDALVKTVRAAFPTAHRFYALKKKLLGLKKLTYADRAAKIGTLKQKMTFHESIEIVRSAFYELGERYGTIFDTFLTEGRIDVYPKTGKLGGAYCSHGIGTPTLVFLNHVDTVGSLVTLAHEMGHAVHSELSKSQSVLYQDYSIAVAEVASTLFESIVFEKVLQKLSPQEQVIALHDRINDSVATIFRQIACFSYELAMHTAIRERGALSKDEMATMHNTYMQEYLGSSVKMEKSDGAFFIDWPHIRYSFYVYSYAYGQLISHGLYARFKKDRGYFKKIEKFLSAGGSKSPRDIFKETGIDVADSAFFKEGLQDIEKELDRLEKLTKKFKFT